MSLISKESSEETRLKEMQTSVYSHPQFMNCIIHKLPKDLTCLQQKCPNQYQPFCRECHSFQSHSLISAKHIIPRLIQWLSSQWTNILKDHKMIESEWKHCIVNIDYCIDILTQIKTQIQQRSQKVSFPAFSDLLNQVYYLFHHEKQHISVEELLKKFSALHKKYNLFSKQGKNVACQVAQQERHFNTQQVNRASKSTKLFSETALGFSEKLASIIEEKLNYQKRVSRLHQISQTRIFTLKDLTNQAEQRLEEVGEVMLEVGKKKQEQKQSDIGKLLNKCRNLKSLRVNSKSQGVTEKHKWKQVIEGMQYLKFLKQLVLNLKSCDIPFLIQLFKDKNKAIRQVQKLTLTISDQKNLNVKEVCEFVNTMELRNLHLVLTRDSLQRQQIVILLKNIRLSTSMSQLPINQFILNLSKNKVQDGNDIAYINQLFRSKASNIKQNSLIL